MSVILNVLKPQFKWFPFCPDGGGVFVFKDVVCGEAIPIVVFTVTLGANI